MFYSGILIVFLNLPLCQAVLSGTSKDDILLSTRSLDPDRLQNAVRKLQEYSGGCGSDDREEREWIEDQYEDLDFDPEGTGEVALGITNILEVPTVSRINDEARAETARRYPQGGHNDEADAFRHAYFSARLTQELGAESAKEWGDAHEISNENEPEERIMDLNNNMEGRKIGKDNPDLSPEDLAKKIQDEIRKEDSPFMSSPPTCGGDVNGKADPHFKGFDGKRFSFHGEHNKTYVLFGKKGGDLLVSRMRKVERKESKLRKVDQTFFDEFGVTVGATGSHITVSLEKDDAKEKEWVQVVRVEGKRVDVTTYFDHFHIHVRQNPKSVIISTEKTIFSLRPRRTRTGVQRHQDFSISLKKSSGFSDGYFGVVGRTVTESSNERDLAQTSAKLRGKHLEDSLRSQFVVKGLFPDLKY